MARYQKENRGENIKKIFDLEVRDKKRIGVNIFKRVSSRKGGSKYVSPSDFLKPKELKLMSGEVKVFNIYETIMPYTEFTKRPEEQQRAIMKQWRDRFANKDIWTGLGVGKITYYKLVESLNLKTHYKKRNSVVKKVGTNNSKIFKPQIDLNQYLDEVIDIETFKQIDRSDRATLFFHYLEYYSIQELAEKWDVTPQYLHTMKYKFTHLIKDGKIVLRELEKPSEDKVEEIEEQQEELILEQQEDVQEEVEEEIVVEEPVKEHIINVMADNAVEERERDEYTLDDIMNTPMKIEPIINTHKFEPITENKSTLNIQFTKELTPMELIQQIQSLTFLLDHNQKYKFEFKVNN